MNIIIYMKKLSCDDINIYVHIYIYMHIPMYLYILIFLYFTV